MLDAVIHSWFPVADIRHFMNGESAYQELLREPPDLFTQDVMHGDPDGDEILRRLTEKDVKYPIFVMSAWARKKEQLRPGCLGPNLNVTFFPKPFALDELYWILLKFVGLSGTTGVHLMTP
jgi:DNA-binding response OmpR family regulator